MSQLSQQKQHQEEERGNISNNDGNNGTRRVKRRPMMLRYDYGEDMTKQGEMQREKMDQTETAGGYHKYSPHAQKRSLLSDPFQRAREGDQIPVSVQVEQSTRTKPSIFNKRVIYRPEEPLNSWDNAAFFLYRRPWLTVSAWGLGGCFLSMVAGLALRRSTNDVVWLWSNVSIFFQVATVGSLVYYMNNPPEPRLPESYTKYMQEDKEQRYRLVVEKIKDNIVDL